MFTHTFFFERSIESAITLTRHLQSIQIYHSGLLSPAWDLLSFALYATIAVWLHHKAEKRVKRLATFGICLAAIAAAYKSIP